MARITFVVALLAGMLTDPALAAGTLEERAACTPDAFKFCTAVFPLEDRVLECLKDNLANLSPACHDVLASYYHAPPRRK
jgi:hypothetical protein